jgi:predicted aspartyl protease/Tfp pilus assembly protein PilF
MPGAVGTAGASNCKMVKIAELPVRVAQNKLIVEGAINGQKVGILLDTGAGRTTILRSAAERLGLGAHWAAGVRMSGVGGETDVESAVVNEFKLGEAVRKDWRMYVAGENDLGNDFAVLLGDDFFHLVDVEFDLAHSTVRLFEPRDCTGVALAYWANGDANEADIEAVNDAQPQIVLIIRINGRPVRAMLDSGAGTSVLNTADAARLGVTPESPGVVALGKHMQGMGKETVDSWIAPFESVAIGDELIRDTSLAFGDLSGMSTGGRLRGPAMLLGADFLRAHRVLVAHSQGKMYFTYAGGPVFRRPESARTAADQSHESGKDGANSAAALNSRGNAFMAKGDLDHALAEYDAALKVDPQYAPAIANRGSIEVAKGDYAQGIVDATRAIELNPKLASAFVIRGNAKRRTGDFQGAITDYAHAIEIEPKLASAYNQLAWALATADQPVYRDGRRAVEAAIKACELSDWKNSTFIDTLAAAYARAGSFADAAKWERKAMESSRLASDAEVAQRLQLYEQGKAWPPD